MIQRLMSTGTAASELGITKWGFIKVYYNKGRIEPAVLATNGHMYWDPVEVKRLARERNKMLKEQDRKREKKARNKKEA